MRTIVWISIIATIEMTACVPLGHSDKTPSPTPRISGLDLTKNQHLAVASLYTLSDGVAATVLDFASNRLINDSVGRVQETSIASEILKREQYNVGNRPGICSPRARFHESVPLFLCEAPSPVSASIMLVKGRRVQLRDPFVALELLNRPLSGLSYNREAEARIAQWRVSIVAAGNSSTRPLALCVETSRINEAAIIIKGDLPLESAKLVGRKLAAEVGGDIDTEEIGTTAEGSIVTYSFRVHTNFIYRAIFRVLRLPPDSTDPRVEFALGGVRQFEFGTLSETSN